MSKKKSPQELTKNSIEDRFVDVSEMPTHLKALFYGRSGTGKTHIAGTFPKPILLLDVKEIGTTTLRSQSGIKVLKVETWLDVEEVYWYLAGPGKGKFQTVVIDTVTQLQDLALKHVTGADGGTISRRAWGEAASLLKTWITFYRDLEMNVVFTAQDRMSASDEVEDEGAIDPEMGPYLMPSVAKILNAAVSVIGNTFIREREKKVKVGDKTKTKTVTEFCLRIGPHARYLTKLRRDPSMGGEVPAVLANPAYSELLQLSIGGKE